MPTSKPPGRSAADYFPARLNLASAREAVARCRGCDLYRDATHAVFGEGPPDAQLVLVGETAGDAEDRAGRPFVGPAGRLLDRALADAGLDRSRAWVTNAVKHFKWQAKGKLRLHQKPAINEITACRPWLELELALLRPRALVCLGATATRSLLGPDVRLTRQRGLPLPSPLAPLVIVTAHPSSVLRAPDEQARHDGYRDLVRDLAVVARWLAAHAPPPAAPPP